MRRCPRERTPDGLRPGAVKIVSAGRRRQKAFRLSPKSTVGRSKEDDDTDLHAEALGVGIAPREAS
jgi:hypothetical protein